jgi:hypothetical protein
MTALRHERSFAQSLYFYGQTIKNKGHAGITPHGLCETVPLGDPGNSARELTRQNRPLEPRPWFECGGQAGNTNCKGYSRRVVLGSSVNVIANPVRVAPIPKVIAHVPTNISITASGARL